MQLLVVGKDIIELVRDIQWSGDTKEVSRKITFVIYQNYKDKLMPVVNISNGDDVILNDDKGNVLFAGVIHNISKSSSEKTITYIAYDLMFYVNKSEISKVFDATPEAITASVCNELGVPFGNAQSTGVNVYYPCIQKSGYEAIMIAYTEASKRTGNYYIPMIKNINKLHVIIKGLYSGVVVDGTYNLIDASYTSTSEEVVNMVVIADKAGNTLTKLDDIASRNKYGTLQKVYQKEDDVDATTQAKALFHSIDQSGTITCLGDIRAISGYSLAVQEVNSGLYGLFFIESDTHTFMNGKHEMALTLAFANSMDEKELPKEDKEK